MTEPPPNGLTNTVYIAESDAGKVVLRVSSPDEIHTYRKEANVAAHAHKLGVRTPRVLGIGNTEHESFHVSQFIPGCDLNSSLVPSPSDAWRQVGEMARRLHECRIPFNTPEWRPDASLSAWALGTLRFCTAPSASGALHLGAERVEPVTQALESLARRTISSVFCHGNLQGNNVRVDESGAVWLLDWSAATGHTPLLDIAELYSFPPGEANRNAFYAGYGEHLPDDDPFVRELVILRLASGKVWLNEMIEADSASAKAKRYIAEEFRATQVLDRYLGLA